MTFYRDRVLPLLVGYGYWLVYRSSKLACAEGEACAHPLANRRVKAGAHHRNSLILAALGLDLLAPTFSLERRNPP